VEHLAVLCARVHDDGDAAQGQQRGRASPMRTMTSPARRPASLAGASGTT
jgi:hypothetical protein